MKSNIIKQLTDIKEEVLENSTNLEKIKQLKQEAINSFDKKIAQLKDEYGLVEKIKIPKSSIKLWGHRNKPIEIPVNWRYLISSPFIYGMIFPAVIWHLCIETYHQVCFRLYRIPLVKRNDYFVYDRQLLSLLSIWEKINCIYCSYVNNLIRYSTEIGGRTERYWCPIKYYHRIESPHSQYAKFVEGDDPKEMRKQWEELRSFEDLK